MSKIAYLRVSTIDQNLDRQFDLMKDKNIDKYYTEKASGKDTNRPEFKKMMGYLREGDEVYIESISRLARNTLDFLTIVKELQEKNIKLVSLKENIDTSTAQGEFIMTIFGAMYKMERDTIKQRQAEGIAVAKAQGKHLGRPKVTLDDNAFGKVYATWKAGNITAVQAFSQLGITKSMFYNRVKEFEKGVTA